MKGRGMGKNWRRARRVTALGLACASSLLLAGCGGHTADGKITTKQYEPGYTSIVMIPCGSNGMMCPNTQVYPDSYEFYVDHKECDVDAGTYAKFNKGDHYKGSCA